MCVRAAPKAADVAVGAPSELIVRAEPAAGQQLAQEFWIAGRAEAKYSRNGRKPQELQKLLDKMPKPK